MYFFLFFYCLVLSISAIDLLERLVSEMAHYVSSEMLNPTDSLTNPAYKFFLLDVTARQPLFSVILSQSIKVAAQSAGQPPGIAYSGQNMGVTNMSPIIIYPPLWRYIADMRVCHLAVPAKKTTNLLLLLMLLDNYYWQCIICSNAS